MLTSAYYFRAHQYTFVPHQVEADMQWMADHGTNAVVIGILEQDLHAAVENVAGICAAAARHGMRAFITPSRWGNLVAGCPKVPSVFSSTRPDVLAQDEQGAPSIGFLGGHASIHHPDTQAFFIDSLQQCFDLWPISGIIWDEPKGINVVDYSDSAVTAFNEQGWDIHDAAQHETAAINFFDTITAPFYAKYPDCHMGLFTFGWETDARAEKFSALANLHAVGCDGRPWPRGMGSTDSGISTGPTGGAGKSLIDDGPRFVQAARAAGKDPLFLIENHAVKAGDLALLERYLPAVMQQDIGHLIYYYYPRSCECPDESMQLIGNALMAR